MPATPPRLSVVRLLAAFVLLACCVLIFVSTVAAQTSVTISPTTAAVATPGGKQQFTATVTTTRRNKSVRWSLSGSGCSGAPCGTLSATSSNSGVPITYTAPAMVPTPSSVTLTATSAVYGLISN